MGIKQTLLRLILGWKTEGEDDEESEILQGSQKYHNYRNGYINISSSSKTNFSVILGKIFCLHKLLNNALKCLLHKLISLSNFVKTKNRANHPILPVVVDPTIKDPDLLVETLLVISSSPDDHHSSSSSGSISPFVPHPPPYKFYPYEQSQSQSQSQSDSSSQEYWPEENYYPNSSTDQTDHRHHVIISIPPNFNYSLSQTCVDEDVFDEEIVPQNVACLKYISSTGRVGGAKTEEPKGEDDKVVVIKNVDYVVVDELSARWIKHYSSRQRILLVGEGDFSFSACLAVAFVQASNMVATSLDSQEFLMENYKNAPFNIEKLRRRGGKVIHGVDATKIANHALLGLLTFDRIIYNFPFAGFFKNLSRESQLRRHRQLVSLFLKNAKEMINEYGEIHITHKANEFHNEWKLEFLASSHGLRFIEAVPFHYRDYRGYRTKCGFGGDNNFNCNPSKTYKFGL